MSRYILLSFLLLWQTCELLSHHIILGRVTNASTGETLSGVTLFIPSIHKGTISDEMGSFKIADLTDQEYDLIVSFLGFVSLEIRTTSNAFIDIQLEPAILNSSEMVVNNSRGFAATMSAINKIDLELQPTRSSQGILRMIPGLITAELFYSISKIELDISLESILGDVLNEARFETTTTIVDDSEPVLELHYTTEAPVYVKCRGTYFF